MTTAIYPPLPEPIKDNVLLPVSVHAYVNDVEAEATDPAKEEYKEIDAQLNASVYLDVYTYAKRYAGIDDSIHGNKLFKMLGKKKYTVAVEKCEERNLIKKQYKSFMHATIYHRGKCVLSRIYWRQSTDGKITVQWHDFKSPTLQPNLFVEPYTDEETKYLATCIVYAANNQETV